VNRARASNHEPDDIRLSIPHMHAIHYGDDAVVGLILCFEDEGPVTILTANASERSSGT
jgi:hypothetical protein